MSLAHARGALLGLAVGDALGTTHEFETGLTPPPFPSLATGPLRDIVGGGPFHLAPGQVTDDTQMACLLAEALRAGFPGSGSPAPLYVEWMRIPPPDIGGQTRAALELVCRGTAPAEAGRRVWIDGGRAAAGNGSLMRTAPIGALLPADAGLRWRATFDDCAVTHFDPRCQLACIALNAAVAAAARAKTEPTTLDLLTAARAEVPGAAVILVSRVPDDADAVISARGDILEDLHRAGDADPDLYSPKIHITKTQGFVRVALRLAFWELLHAPDFESALVDVVNRGGDADTNGAIAGALLGARYGEDGIPRRWRKAVESAEPERRLKAMAGRCHPRTMIP